VRGEVTKSNALAVERSVGKPQHVVDHASLEQREEGRLELQAVGCQGVQPERVEEYVPAWVGADRRERIRQRCHGAHASGH
jgi:hypothetical protein